jgi:hypothetical protein
MPNDTEEIKHVPSVYADGIRVNVSTATITFLFTQSDPWAPSPGARPVAQVQMSPVQFKMLSKLLPELLAEYERSFGEIAVQNIEMALRSEPDQGEEERDDE